MVARKGRTLLVFEFKSGGYGSLFGSRVISEFRAMLSDLGREDASKAVPYLVTGTKFASRALTAASKAGIRVIQGGDPK